MRLCEFSCRLRHAGCLDIGRGGRASVCKHILVTRPTCLGLCFPNLHGQANCFECGLRESLVAIPEIRSLCVAQVRSFLLCPRCSGASKSAAHLPTCFKSSGFARCRSEKQDVLCFTALLAKDILQKKAEASVGGLEFDRRYQWRFEGWQGQQRALKDIMKVIVVWPV